MLVALLISLRLTVDAILTCNKPGDVNIYLKTETVSSGIKPVLSLIADGDV